MSKTVFGYVFNEQGKHSGKVAFEGTPLNIAHFIMFNANSKTVITDTLDNFLVSSIGGFLDQVESDRLREEILLEILPIQLGDVPAVDITCNVPFSQVQ